MTENINSDIIFNEDWLNPNDDNAIIENNGDNDQQVKEKKKKKGGGFQSFNLSPYVYKAIMTKGYNLPTPIQRRAIPNILQGYNVIAMARTGSGKTASFMIPIIEKLKQHSKIVGARCLILSPTREIAL
jgi:ATP-dependent RNA helicase DDX54/DBP10